MNWVSIGSGNGLASNRHQAISWTNVNNWTLRDKIQWNSNQNTQIFVHGNAFENVVCEMAAILSRRRWVKKQNASLASTPWGWGGGGGGGGMYMYKQRVLVHGHQGWNVRRGLCHIYMRYVYIWVVYSLCFFCCLFITVTWWYVWCIEWASGNQEEVQACLVTLWLFIMSCYSLYKTTLGLLCSWFENNHIFINTQWIFMFNVSI